jgi:hypothetical protein
MPEHGRIVAELLGKRTRRTASLKDRNLHGSPPCHLEGLGPMLK